MIKISRVSLFVLLIVYGCGHKGGQNCSEFLEKYPRVASGPWHDTTLLIKTLNDIISSDSVCIDAYLARGDLFFYSGDNKKARADYSKVILEDHKNVHALYKMGLLYQEDELYDSSIYFLQMAIGAKTHGGVVVDFNSINKDLETDDAKYDVPSGLIYLMQGISFYHSRNLKEAFRVFDFCITNNVQLAKAYLYRGAIYEETNKRDSACEDFRKAKFYGNAEADEYLKKYCN